MERDPGPVANTRVAVETTPDPRPLGAFSLLLSNRNDGQTQAPSPIGGEFVKVAPCTPGIDDKRWSRLSYPAQWKAPSSMRRRSYGTGGLQHRHRIYTGSLERCCDSQQESGDHRPSPRGRQHVRVQPGMEREAFTSAAKRQRQEANFPNGEEDAGRAAERG